MVVVVRDSLTVRVTPPTMWARPIRPTGQRRPWTSRSKALDAGACLNSEAVRALRWSPAHPDTSGFAVAGVGRAEGFFDAAVQGVTTTDQHLQGDTRGAPAGQVTAGSRKQAASRSDPRNDDKDRGPVRPTPTATPTATGVQACNTQTRSGGAGTTVTTHHLGRSSGTFQFEYQPFSVPDRFIVTFEGSTLLDTGSVANGASHTLPFAGSTTIASITVIGPTGTAWNYTVFCPAEYGRPPAFTLPSGPGR